MVMQARVLIRLITDAMFGARSSRYERCRGSAVQVVDNVVPSCPQQASDTRARGSAASREGDDIIDVWKTVEHRRNPIFKKNVDGCVRQKPF